MIFAPTLVLVVIQALVAQASVLSPQTRPADDIGALCAGKPIDLTTFFELRQLQTLAPDSSCSVSIKDAIQDLVTLIVATRYDMCADKSISKLREFYAKHLDTSSADGKERDRLPESLKQFALAYGMHMSNLCKKKMVSVLTHEGRKLLETGDFRLLKRLSEDKNPVAKVLEGLTGPDEVLLPGDLAPYMREEGKASRGEPEKLYLQSGAASKIRDLQTACYQRLRPLYKPLMHPLVQLANMGFNYKDEPLKCYMKCPATAEHLGQWSRLVFLCESLLSIHPVEDPADQEEGAKAAQDKIVRILTKEEAVAIETQIGVNSTQQVAQPELHESMRSWYVRLSVDKILDRSDARLAKAIKAFKTSRSEADRVKKRMTSKGLALLKNQLKRGKIGVVMSAGYQSLMQRIKGGDEARPLDDIVMFVDELVEHDGDSERGDLLETIETVAIRILATVAAVAHIVFVAGPFIMLIIGAASG